MICKPLFSRGMLFLNEILGRIPMYKMGKSQPGQVEEEAVILITPFPFFPLSLESQDSAHRSMKTIVGMLTPHWEIPPQNTTFQKWNDGNFVNF